MIQRAATIFSSVATFGSWGPWPRYSGRIWNWSRTLLLIFYMPNLELECNYVFFAQLLTRFIFWPFPTGNGAWFDGRVLIFFSTSFSFSLSPSALSSVQRLTTTIAPASFLSFALFLASFFFIRQDCVFSRRFATFAAPSPISSVASEWRSIRPFHFGAESRSRLVGWCCCCCCCCCCRWNCASMTCRASLKVGHGSRRSCRPRNAQRISSAINRCSAAENLPFEGLARVW